MFGAGLKMTSDVYIKVLETFVKLCIESVPIGLPYI